MSVTRRVFFQASAAVIGGAGLASIGASQASAKVAQNVVQYQGTPKGDQQCSNCKWFEPPQSCKLVDGAISPSGWCTLWVKA